MGSTRGQRDPLQLAEHSGDAAGIVPAVADVPGRIYCCIFYRVFPRKCPIMYYRTQVIAYKAYCFRKRLEKFP